MALKWKSHIFFLVVGFVFVFQTIKTFFFCFLRISRRIKHPFFGETLYLLLWRNPLPITVKRLREVRGKISLSLGKYNSTVPVCCPCLLSEKELNINYSKENLNKVWKSSEGLGRSRWGSCRIPIIGVLKTRLNNSPDVLHPVFLWEWGVRSSSVVSPLSGFCGSQTVRGWGNLTVKVDAILYS